MGGPFTPDPLGSTWPSPFPWLSFGFSGPVPGFSLLTVSGPVAEPVDVETAKRQTRIDYADEDSLYAIWIPAARQLVEREAATVMVRQTLQLALPMWPADGRVQLPVGPVTAVNSVKYYAPTATGNGTLTTLVEGTDYLTWVEYRPPFVYPAPGHYWPVVQFGRVPAVLVEFVAGYDAASVPQMMKQAVLMVVAYWARNRGDVDAPEQMGIPAGARRLIRNLSDIGYR